MLAAFLGVHLLAAIIWIGGMFFAYLCLRPVAAEQLEPPQRLSLWQGVFSHFFRWVWIAIALLIISGHGMIGVYGGMKAVGLHVHIMLGLGYLMIALFGHLYFSPYRKLGKAVATESWQDAGKALNQIRMIVAINLSLGLAIALVASAGKFYL